MLSPGTTLGGRYRLDERIAGGGMGDVWRGTDEVLGRTVAIKVLLPALLDEPGFAERFRGEARTMATINHPGVVDVYDYGSENGTAFLIMEYIEGDALSRTLSRVGRLTPARTMALLAQAADALHAAHDKGVIHRDVKPGNLLVRPNGTLVLTDFGIARSAMVGQLTAAGSVLGTASYISPEQASGATATALSDVYALGVVAYQCLSGHRPFEGDNPLEIAMRHVRDTPPPLPADIPPVVRQVVDRAMAKDPAARWPNAAALAQVARRTAAQLAGGNTSASGMANLAAPTGPGSPVAPISPVSAGPPGPPGSPVSRQYPMPPPISPMVPPGSPVSPGLPPGPVAAGGTRIMPGVNPAGPPISGPPSSQHGARGAAGVPPPPSMNDTIYTYGGGGPAGVGAPPPPPPPTPLRPGGPPGRPPAGKRRNNLVLIAVVLAVLVVLVFGGGIIWFLTKSSGTGDNNNGGTTPTNGTTTGAPQPTGELVNVPCDNLRNKQLFVVQRNLQQRGFKVVTQQVTGAIPNNVADISPCGDQPKGSTITLKVVKSAIDPGFPSNGNSPPGGDQSPAGPGGPSTSPSCDNPVPGTNLCLPG
jgi:serine/threonine protein kinase